MLRSIPGSPCSTHQQVLWLDIPVLHHAPPGDPPRCTSKTRAVERGEAYNETRVRCGGNQRRQCRSRQNIPSPWLCQTVGYNPAVAIGGLQGAVRAYETVLGACAAQQGTAAPAQYVPRELGEFVEFGADKGCQF